MYSKVLVIVGLGLLAVAPGMAWNRVGHMVTGAIAYDGLLLSRPATVARLVAILRQHPQYESSWKPQKAGMNDEQQGRLLFMLAARWPDDIRGDNAYDHPLWHYIDYPYKPPGQPASVHAVPPAAENLVTAFQQNAAVLQGAATDPQKAIALCWIFHLIGDAHQPLHATMLFTTQFPEGDRGGNLFYIRPDPSSPMTENLHAYWDNLLLTDDRYAPAAERASTLEKARPRKSLRELSEPNFETWVKKESFDLAVSAAYRKGKLVSGPDRNNGVPLPQNYHAAAVRVAERRVALAGYRLADFLQTNLP